MPSLGKIAFSFQATPEQYTAICIHVYQMKKMNKGFLKQAIDLKEDQKFINSLALADEINLDLYKELLNCADRTLGEGSSYKIITMIEKLVVY